MLKNVDLPSCMMPILSANSYNFFNNSQIFMRYGYFFLTWCLD